MTLSNNITTGQISQLRSLIKQNAGLLESKTATAGFDGFIDTIVRIIKEKQDQQIPSFFKNKHEFGNYILEKEGTNCSLEVEQLSIKLGGNMPIMANALGRLGITVNCIGALGYPNIHSIFNNFPANCHLYSFTEPGTSTAVEFNDGKILLGNMGFLNTSGWNFIKNIIGIDTLINLYKGSDLLSIVNWSEIDASTDIWKGLLQDVLPAYTKPADKQIAFFDLSDCSKRSNESIMEVLELLKQFSQYTRVILGLNKNEARLIYQALYGKSAEEDLKKAGEKIFEKLKLDILLLHSSKQAIAFNKKGIYASDSFFIDNPKISTGAGDNFNAGFATAQLLQLDAGSSVIFANAVAALYINTAVSPSLAQVESFLELKEK